MKTAGGSCTTGVNNNDTCNVTISDNAGNSVDCPSPANYVDTLLPTITAGGAGADWLGTRQSAQVHYGDQVAAGNSGMSGIDRAAYAWTTNNLGADCSGGTALYSSGDTFFAPEPAGSHTLYLCVKDQAGNVGTNSGNYNWDDAAPILTLNNSSSSIYYDTARATITASDNLSGLATIYYRWNEDTNVNENTCGGAGASPLTGFGVGTTGEFTSPDALPPPDYGENMLYVCAVDRAGNITAASAPSLYGSQLDIGIISTSGNATDGVTISGSVHGSNDNQELTVFADVCNTSGQCLRRSTALNSGAGNTTQEFSLSWVATDLPIGTYSGTVWVSLQVGGVGLSTQSGNINFTINPNSQTMKLTVIKNQAFNINLGDSNLFQLADGTSNGITATNTNNEVYLSGTLTTSTTATFGHISVQVTVIEPPQLTISNVSFE
jgi:hypothetical protein